jgi:hypothetical protein
MSREYTLDEMYPPPIKLMRLMAETLESIPEEGLSMELLPPCFKVEHMQMFGAVIVEGTRVYRGPDWQECIDGFRDSYKILEAHGHQDQ